MTPGQRVIKIASKYVGVREVPDGSNQSPQINKWSSHWGMKAVPWCGTYCSGVLREAKVTDVSHPSTYLLCQNAKKKGWVSDKPVPGALVVWCGTHVGILVEEMSPGVWRTLEGNTANQVAYRTRSLKGTTIVVPPEIRKNPGVSTPKRQYWLEDPKATPTVIGPWRSKAYRDSVYDKMDPIRKRRARKIRYKGKYALSVGPKKVYGPWDDTSSRDNAKKLLEKSLGRNLRPFSTVPPKAAAEDLGQTT
jgi:hypothetical protein